MMTGKRYTYGGLDRAVLSIFSANRPGKRFTTTELIEKLYPRGRVPLTARQTVMGIMTRLIVKVEMNREKFRIFRTTGMGPRPNEFWKEIMR